MRFLDHKGVPACSLVREELDLLIAFAGGSGEPREWLTCVGIEPDLGRAWATDGKRLIILTADARLETPRRMLVPRAALIEATRHVKRRAHEALIWCEGSMPAGRILAGDGAEIVYDDRSGALVPPRDLAQAIPSYPEGRREVTPYLDLDGAYLADVAYVAHAANARRPKEQTWTNAVTIQLGESDLDPMTYRAHNPVLRTSYLGALMPVRRPTHEDKKLLTDRIAAEFKARAKAEAKAKAKSKGKE